ncbi:type I polyketide synthase [Frankia sp. Cppng1_Ct_nod]|uniref:type I polyketide synthase n=1 Tax=Frankia sp. Cppng1_Ct_nod TaxID=2897162 RepID=UPI001041246C|nr:type I polyketide synthase [Frankia sp. Cppng1_Ct_nod]
MTRKPALTGQRHGAGRPASAVPEPVAIVGIGCRLPGAHGSDEFWHVLRTGSDTVTQIPDERSFGALYDPRPGTPGRIASRAGGFLEDIDAFDADFFDISPREAARMDPQQRLLLETSWEAFEDAGQTRDSLAGSRTSVFLAYLSTQYSELLREAGICDMHSAIGAEGRGTAAGRLSYAFDLRGPSMALDATCASSLLAIHMACQSIRSGESTLALAGGVNIMLTPDLSIALSQAGVLSRYGRSRFGDAAADGYVRSEGIAVVILKSLQDALADGDRVYAVIRGSGITNDGRSGGSVTAPSVESQVEMLRTAYHNAGVEPHDIDYIEAHGTGTVMGDQIELTAIAEVLSEGRPSDQPCILGSAKSNIGHTEGAAGMVGIIKVALSLHHRTIPASLHIAEPNPAVPWDDLPIVLATTVRRWPDRGRPRLGGVSAFGLSGTNVHVVLAEAPHDQTAANSVRNPSEDDDDRPVLLPLSARTPAALPDLVRAYLRHLDGDATGQQPSLADICWNAGMHRTHHEHRMAVVGRTRAEMAERLRAVLDGRNVDGVSIGPDTDGDHLKIAFVFPGQGSQWVGMGRELLESSPTFRAAVEECDAAVRNETGWSVIECLMADESLSGIDVVQPVLWSVEVGLAAMWRELGFEPDVVIGHSMGEVAAACVAGALTLADAAAVICRRSKILRTVSGQGAMVSVQLSMQEAQRMLVGFDGEVSVAVTNSDSSVVLSGSPDALERLTRPLRERGVFCRPVQVDVASHSPQMDPLRDELMRTLADVRPQAGDIPIQSTVTGERTDGIGFDSDYWFRNLREPVRFSSAVHAVLDDAETVFIEMGPHPMLVNPIAEIIDVAGAAGTALCPLNRNDSERMTVLEAVGTLFTLGYEPDWTALRGGTGTFVSLPTYPWQRRRYWIGDATGTSSSGGGFRDTTVHPVSAVPSVPSVPSVRPVPVVSVPEQRQPSDELGAAVNPETSQGPTQSFEGVSRYLVEQVAVVLGLSADSANTKRPLTKIGLDSLLAAELHTRIEQDLGIKVPVVGLLRGANLEQFAADVWAHACQARPATNRMVGRVTYIPTESSLWNRAGVSSSQALLVPTELGKSQIKVLTA